MTQTNTPNGYLDQLVIKYLMQNNPLEILDSALESERPTIFLDKIGWGPKKDYFEDTLNAYLAEQLPIGPVYVFTPNDSFKYQKTDTNVSNVGIRSTRDAEETFSDGLKDIIDGSKRNNVVEVSAYFFNEDSKNKFEEGLRKMLTKEHPKKDIQSLSPEEINITGYGVIKLYRYKISPSPQPYK